MTVSPSLLTSAKSWSSILVPSPYSAAVPALLPSAPGHRGLLKRAVRHDPAIELHPDVRERRCRVADVARRAVVEPDHSEAVADRVGATCRASLLRDEMAGEIGSFRDALQVATPSGAVSGSARCRPPTGPETRERPGERLSSAAAAAC